MDRKSKIDHLLSAAYLTVELEMTLPPECMNTGLIHACLNTIEGLSADAPISKKEIADTTKNLIIESRKKEIRPGTRIIAAVISAILIVTMLASCGVIRDLLRLFGMDKVNEMNPGEKITMDNHELEMPMQTIFFDTIDEMLEHIGQPIYLPSDMLDGAIIEKCFYNDLENPNYTIHFNKNNTQLTLILYPENKQYTDEEFATYEHERYTKDGAPFFYIGEETQWQATGIIDGSLYILIAPYRESLDKMVDSMEKTE